MRTVTPLPTTELEVATGNYDESRTTIDRVIIHTMVGTWQSAAARFDDPSSQVSAHYGVKLDGGLIHWLEETFTAYHAGDYAMNQRSIGIEHEDGGDYNGARPDSLYSSSAKLVRDICQYYNIPIDRDHIKKHNEVSDKPTGCPDALDIDRIVKEASTDIQSTIDEIRKARDGNWDLYQTELQKNNTLSKQLQDEQTKNQTLREANDKLTSGDADTGAQLLDAQHKVSDLQAELDTLAEALKCPSDFKSILTAIDTLQQPHEQVVKNVQPLIEGLAAAAIGKKPKLVLGPIFQWAIDHGINF